MKTGDVIEAHVLRYDGVWCKKLVDVTEPRENSISVKDHGDDETWLVGTKQTWILDIDRSGKNLTECIDAMTEL